jgi:hypothetical protein
MPVHSVALLLDKPCWPQQKLDHHFGHTYRTVQLFTYVLVSEIYSVATGRGSTSMHINKLLARYAANGTLLPLTAQLAIPRPKPHVPLSISVDPHLEKCVLVLGVQINILLELAVPAKTDRSSNTVLALRDMSPLLNNNNTFRTRPDSPTIRDVPLTPCCQGASRTANQVQILVWPWHVSTIPKTSWLVLPSAAAYPPFAAVLNAN